jgi:hypothetical protein
VGGYSGALLLQVPKLLPEHVQMSEGLAFGLALHVLALLSWSVSYALNRWVLV